MKYARITIAMIALVAVIGLENTKAQSERSFGGVDLVDQNGNIRKPKDYRDRYQMLGAYTITDPKGDQMHFTYASPGAAEYCRRNKDFAELGLTSRSLQRHDGSSGKSTLTTVPSMNARLDPRIVAARTQGRALAEHGTWTGEETITPASQGCVMAPRLCNGRTDVDFRLQSPVNRAAFCNF